MEYALSAVFALLVWWLGTGVVLLLNGRPAAAHGAIMGGATLVLLFALAGLRVSSAEATVAGAFCAFTCAVLVWSWLELSYLLGWVTGPRTTACPEGATGWPRFWYALQTSIWHELAVVAVGFAIFVLTRDAPNQVALGTFLVLWLMRWSAKLNVFLGVANLNTQWLPDHMRYLGSYFGKRRINLVFPLSVTLPSIVAVMLAGEALGAASGSFEATGYTLVTTFLALAIVEHWFLVLPVPDAVLWHWAQAPEPEANAERLAARRASL